MRASSRSSRRHGVQGPKIACFNRARTPLGVEWDALIAALQVYVDKFVAPPRKNGLPAKTAAATAPGSGRRDACGAATKPSCYPLSSSQCCPAVPS